MIGAILTKLVLACQSRMAQVAVGLLLYMFCLSMDIPVILAHRENECITLPVLSIARVQFLAGVFREILPWLITLCQTIFSQQGR